MTDEHAMKVWREADRAGEDAYVEAVETGTTAVEAHEAGNQAAAAVIAADRAGLVAEVERLVRAWEEQHKEKVKERGESRLWFEKAQKWAEENARLREALERIEEYWNRDQNETAMADACWNAVNTADAALKGTRHDADA